jgi:crossover junction endodeoxyribonuclease RuvC
MTAPRLFAGIDPGLSGAVGLVHEDGSFAAVVDMPCTLTTTGRRQVDPAALAEILRQHAPAFVLVERVGPRPKEGAVGAFSFGQTFGGILAVLATLNIPHDLVQPAAWKRRAGIPPGADKRASVTTAKRLLPDAAGHLARVKDDGRAEALLLALQAWERRQ